MNLRLDKFVWCVRLTKTRKLASELIAKGKIQLNDADTKPGREVRLNDTIQVWKGNAKMEYRVKGLLYKRVGAPLAKEFVEDITSSAEIEKLKEYNTHQKGFSTQSDGKRSKKDRRDLDRFLDNWTD